MTIRDWKNHPPESFDDAVDFAMECMAIASEEAEKALNEKPPEIRKEITATGVRQPVGVGP